MKKLFLALLFSVFSMGAAAPPVESPKEDLSPSVEFKKKLDELRLRRIQKELDNDDEASVQKMEYTHTPVKDRVIQITDRIIEVPQVITSKNANDMVKKINFYNRKNNFPIFIVMDVCYGGSVVGGEKIIRAIKTSKAKVYIVVKSFAASMAAVITSTFADNAYVLKNAIILHHEISNGVQGNASQHQENIKMLAKWQDILFKPLAERKGMSIEEFVKSLYAIKRDGDAALFASEAVKEKWIFNVIEGVEDGSFNEKPAGSSSINPLITMEEDSVDRIPAEDFYFIYSKVKIIEAK